MLSEKEIGDYVHGPLRLVEKQQFRFSEPKQIWNDVKVRRETFRFERELGRRDLTMDATGDQPGPTSKIPLAAKSNKGKDLILRLRKGGLGESQWNILLILLFIVIFAVMFVLESRQGSANPVDAPPQSATTAVT